MTQPIIEARGLSKRYRLGQFNARSLREEAERLFRRRDTAATDFWALRDVSFEVAPGEVMGVVGRNGAGKSTLLKLLSRVTEPTAGEVRIRGRVASLLEVGTGFHPELTGRENIFLNGAILGMTRTEIRRKFDEIVAFAEVDQFLDTPVKRYSSGMYVRLAFAVAAHLEPEILIVDEVLAVGDAAFQKKCLGKMKRVSTEEGRTVLFVSHNMTAINTLCSRAILMESGRVAAVGPAPSVVRQYLKGADRSAGAGGVWDDLATAPGDDQVRLRRVGIVAGADGTVEADKPVTIEIEFWNLRENGRPQVNVMLYTTAGDEVLEDWAASEAGWKDEPLPVGLFRCACTIPGGLLNEGSFRVRVVLFDNDSVRPLLDIEDALQFDVADLRARAVNWSGRFIGNVHPRLDWKTTLVAPLSGARSDETGPIKTRVTS